MTNRPNLLCAKPSILNGLAVVNFLFVLLAQAASAAAPADFALTCTSSGAGVHVQHTDKPYASSLDDQLAGKTLNVTASVITSPEAKLFAAKPNQALYGLDVSLGEQRLFRMLGHTYDGTLLSDYPDRLALMDAQDSGSSVVLLADGTGGWKGRAISTEGFLERSTADTTIYIALTCRKAEQGPQSEASQ